MANKNENSEIRVFEYFALPRLEKTIFTNPSQLLMNDEKKRLLELCGEDVAGMSDFELFSAFIKNAHIMKKSGALELFSEELSLYFDYSEDIFSADPSDIWKSCCRYLEKDGLKFEDAIRSSKHPENILPIISILPSFEDFIEENLSFISDADTVSIDMSSFEFIRTDRYHADKAYSAYLQGDASQREIFLSGMLYNLFDEAKKRDITLAVYMGDRFESLKTMISYFSERGVLPNIILFALSDIELRVARELCGVYNSGKTRSSVLCGILYENGNTSDIISERIKKIASVYPIGSICLGGSRTSDISFEARHRILKKGMLKAIE